MQKYTVTIDNVAYTIRSNEPEEYIKEAARMVNHYIQEAAAKFSSSSTHQQSAIVLVALQLASQLIQKNEALTQKKLQEEIIKDKIDALFLSLSSL